MIFGRFRSIYLFPLRASVPRTFATILVAQAANAGMLVNWNSDSTGMLVNGTPWSSFQLDALSRVVVSCVNPFWLDA